MKLALRKRSKYFVVDHGKLYYVSGAHASKKEGRYKLTQSYTCLFVVVRGRDDLLLKKVMSKRGSSLHAVAWYNVACAGLWSQCTIMDETGLLNRFLVGIIGQECTTTFLFM